MVDWLLDIWHRLQLHHDLVARGWSVTSREGEEPQLPAHRTVWFLHRDGLADPLTLEFTYSAYANRWAPERGLEVCRVEGFEAMDLFLRQPLPDYPEIRIAWLQEKEVFLDWLGTLPRESPAFCCPACFALALPDFDKYALCHVCGWEEDPAAFFDPQLGGPNHVTIIDSRELFPEYGRCDPYERVSVRPAHPDEFPSPKWPYRFPAVYALARKILPDVDSWRRPEICEVFRCIEPGGRTGTVVEVEDGSDGTWARVRVRLHPDAWNGESYLWVTRRDWEGMRVWLDL